jgi:hypothetical protein
MCVLVGQVSLEVEFDDGIAIEFAVLPIQVSVISINVPTQ